MQIYIITIAEELYDDSGNLLHFIKVGISKVATIRIDSLTKCMPFSIETIAIYTKPHAKVLEGKCLQYLQDNNYRYSGEWALVSDEDYDEVLDAIQRIIETTPEPFNQKTKARPTLNIKAKAKRKRRFVPSKHNVILF